MGSLTGRMMKVICLMAMTGFMVGLTVGEVQAKDYKWKISQGIAEDHPAAARCKQFAKLVEEKSGGRIKMTYFPLLPVASSSPNWWKKNRVAASK